MPPTAGTDHDPLIIQMRFRIVLFFAAGVSAGATQKSYLLGQVFLMGHLGRVRTGCKS